MPTETACRCAPPSSYTLIHCQADRARPAGSLADAPQPKGSLALAALDLRSPWPAVEDMAEVFGDLHRLLRKGGTVVALVDLWSLSHVKIALDRKFAQARFIEVVWPDREADFHPDGNRLMAITAVKGGGSTFNSAYNNGLLTEAPDRPALEILVAEVLANHTNPGDTAALAPTIADQLPAGDFPFPERHRPAASAKTGKDAAA